jgi:hypothetical protein
VLELLGQDLEGVPAAVAGVEVARQEQGLVHELVVGQPFERDAEPRRHPPDGAERSPASLVLQPGCIDG